MRSYRFIPRVRFINYRKEYPNASTGCWCKWFSVERYWGGKIIMFFVKARAIELDFRRNWLADMVNPPQHEGGGK